MRSLKSLSAKKLSRQNEEYNEDDSGLLLTILSRIEDNGEMFYIEDKQIKHYRVETRGLTTKEYVNNKLVKRTEYYPSGYKKLEVWYKNGKKHRDEFASKNNSARGTATNSGFKYEAGYGPAEIAWQDMMTPLAHPRKRYEIWYKNGKEHREGGPAQTHWYWDGNKEYQFWYIDGLKHRENGPAEIWYINDGSIFYEKFYRYGELL